MVGGKFAEAVALDMQGAVEACAQVLESDHGGQFDDLGRVEVPLQIVEGRIGDLCGRARHPLCVAQDRLFAGAEIRATLEIRKVGKLLVGDSLFSAHGRVNIDSEGTADDLRHTHAGERLEPRLDPLRSRERRAQRRVCLGNLGTVRERGQRYGNATEPLRDLR